MDRNMIPAFIILSRKCQYSCRTCLAKPRVSHEGLPPEEWEKIFAILSTLLGVNSFFFGGRDCWEYEHLTALVRNIKNKTVYCSAHPDIWDANTTEEIGQLHVNLNFLRDEMPQTHSEAHSYYAKRALLEMVKRKKNCGLKMRLSAHCTISTMNAPECLLIYNFCVHNDIYPSFSYLHTDTDGGFDLFRKPSDEVILPMSVERGFTLEMIRRFTDAVFIDVHRRKVEKLQYLNDFLNVPLELGVTGRVNDGAHCNGLCPVSVDADGHMRLCPYRRGKRVHKHSALLMLEKGKYRAFLEDREKDLRDCPGCMMTLPFTLSYRSN